MRNLNVILSAFASALALTTMVACEEVDLPPPVLIPKSVETPKSVEAPKVVEDDGGKPVETAIDDTVGEEETGKPEQVIDAARKAMTAGELDRALKLAQIATLKAPRRSASWNTMGRVQLQKGQRTEAIASFEKAVELNPKSSYAQNNLGLALIYDLRFEDAIDALEEAVESEPVEGYMWNNLGMAYEHLDRLEEARDAYQKATSLKNDRATENLARLEGVKTVLRSAKADPLPAVESLDTCAH